MSTPAAPSENLWDAGDVARFLKTSKSWVYHAAASGVLPSLHPAGWMLRFDPDAIRAFARGPESGGPGSILQLKRG